MRSQAGAEAGGLDHAGEIIHHCLCLLGEIVAAIGEQTNVHIGRTLAEAAGGVT